MKFDVAVIGSGLAALIATRTLQQAGRQPVLIWPGLSSLYFVYATVDVLGYTDALSTEPVERPLDGISKLIEKDPDHPYAIAGPAALSAGIEVFLSWVAEAGMLWQGSLATNVLLPTAIGTPKPSCLLPTSLGAGDLGRADPILFCGFRGYEDFVPELAAANLARCWGRAQVRAIRIDPPHFKPGNLFTSIDLARSFEDAAFRREVAARIRAEAVALDGSSERIGLPAILGLTHGSDVHRQFEQELGHRVFEVPTLPPSVLGLRLFDRLRKHLQETGVEIIWAAPAHQAELRNGHCAAVLLKSAGRERPIEAKAYVLALEDTVDGAMRAGVQSIEDPFFHQTVERVNVPPERTAESIFEPQPFARAGYSVNSSLQPLDRGGGPLADNVFVAGGAIAGYDPVATKSRGGLAIATGYRAAREALAA
jgi:glycerol-3-phosphate dehydrogenase subunit B